jgi:hypothetical protein
MNKILIDWQWSVLSISKHTCVWMSCNILSPYQFIDYKDVWSNVGNALGVDHGLKMYFENWNWLCLGLYMPNQVKAPFQLFVKESSIWFYTAQHKSVNLLGILLQISFFFILQCIYIEVCYFLRIVFKSLNKIEYCSLWLHHTSSVVTHNFISFSWFWMLFKVKRQIKINNL